MKEQFTPFDHTKYLQTEAGQVEYLTLCAEDNDPKTLAVALGHVARARGMTQLARDTGVTREALYRALSDAGNPELGTIMKVLAALGLSMTFTPREKHQPEHA
jgi:probable addiction module antidote protein